MKMISDPIDIALLDDWQREFPMCDRPFAAIADRIGIDEADAIARLRKMKQAGRVTRVGATCAPNTVSASTLAAIAAPEERIDEVAAVISAQSGINHSYQREDRWNLWFVATGPDRAHVNATLAKVSNLTGLEVLDLRLMQPFNVDLGFRMRDASSLPSAPPSGSRQIDCSVMQPGDRGLLQRLTTGLPITPRPYAEIAAALGRPETEITNRIGVLLTAGIITRLGVIVRHRALGWSANAMVVWDIRQDRINAVGPRLAALPGVTLCYERRPVPGIWPYRLYNMIHARSHREAHDVLDAAQALPSLGDVAHKVLFSTRCFKQTGALISLKQGTAA